MMIREALEVLSIRLAIKNVDKKMIKRLRAILNQFSEDNL
jgi:DNA-binding GntR family transcriptional regulator